MRRALLVLLLLAASGCSVVVRGGPLSNRPHTGRQVFISTGAPDRPFRTLGFVQVRGYGVEVAGVIDVGDAALDGTLRKELIDAAVRMGGDGVAHVEFLDENPSTPAERASAASQSITNVQQQQGSPESKSRYVTATGEVIKFLE